MHRHAFHRQVLVSVSLHVKSVMYFLYMGTMYPLSRLHSRTVHWTLTILLVYLLSQLHSVYPSCSFRLRSPQIMLCMLLVMSMMAYDIVDCHVVVTLPLQDGSTALMFAAQSGHIETVRLLLAHPHIEHGIKDNVSGWGVCVEVWRWWVFIQALILP